MKLLLVRKKDNYKFNLKIKKNEVNYLTKKQIISNRVLYNYFALF